MEYQFSDKDLVLDLLQRIYDAAQLVQTRCERILCSDDFLTSPGGMEKLDSTCMQLIVIGESLKNIDKLTNKELLPQYPHIDWKEAMGMRDIVCHHYFDIDAESIFTTVKHDLPRLQQAVQILKQIAANQA